MPETQLERYIPHLNYAGEVIWEVKPNYSCYIDGIKYYGLPENSWKYFTPQVGKIILQKYL